MTLVDRHRTTRARPEAKASASAASPGRLLDSRWDVPALGALVLAVIAVHVVTHRGGLALGMDVVTQFVPWYAWLGEHLRAGVVPAWNPAVLSGVPSAGDPLSGWGYLPAMAAFALLPVRWAVSTFMVVQLALVACGTFVLARALRLSVRAAVAAAVVATCNGFVFQRNLCCVAFVSVEAWIPWLLLGIDRAIVTAGARRVGAWAVAGVACAQIAAGWLGQGTLYAVLLAGVWLVARTRMVPPNGRDRRRTFIVNAIGLALVGAGLSAAAVLPRLQINPQTTLAGGYPGQSLSSWYGGWWPTDWSVLVTPGIWHVGALPVTLAVVALVVARRSGLVWLLGGIVVGALLLAMPVVTPVDLLLVWMPGVDQLHTHVPERAMLIAYPAIALLVGVTVSRLRVPRVGRWVPALVVVVLVAGELAWANTVAVRAALAADRNPDLLRRIDVDAFYAPSSAGRYLQGRVAAGQIGRYAALTPVARGDGSLTAASYFFFWHLPSVRRLEAHNEALLLGLEHTQGYNPTHLARYDDLIAAANGRTQDRHVANLTPGGFAGGIFDLLNGRWVVMHRQFDHTDPSVVGEEIATWPVVWQDDRLLVLENPDALPRAWIVGAARQVATGEAPALLADGAVDPRRTALLEVPPPPLDAGANGRARVVARDTDRLIIDVDTDGAALLMLSEIYHPAWRATVDGRPADLFVADHALRAVPVPQGRHTVEVAFDRTVITIGMALTVTTALVLSAIGVRVFRRRGRTT